MSIDVRDYWNFGDPVASEVVFRDLFESNELSHAENLEVWAQIARTYSLRGNCAKCHELLDEKWDDAMAAGDRPKGCFELEKGRAFRSGKQIEQSKPLFESASQNSEDDIKADALHMLAIIAEPDESIRINREALDFVANSTSMWAQRWEGTLSNNLGWSFFGLDNFEEALRYFKQALLSRIRFGQEEQVPIAKWCVARCERALGNLDNALEIQLELSVISNDGYVEEELGEILLAQGKADDAKPHFARAVELLSEELGEESERVQRLKSLS